MFYIKLMLLFSLCVDVQRKSRLDKLKHKVKKKKDDRFSDKLRDLRDTLGKDNAERPTLESKLLRTSLIMKLRRLKVTGTLLKMWGKGFTDICKGYTVVLQWLEL